MSHSCEHFIQSQRHKRLREALSDSQLNDLTTIELRRILRIRRVPVPMNATRQRLIALIKKSEEEDVGGYAGRYWQSPPGIQRRISQLSSNFVWKLVNNSVKIVAQVQKASWLIWVTAADDRVCPICAPRHLRKYRPTWFLPQMPAHASCRCQWETIWEEWVVESKY